MTNSSFKQTSIRSAIRAAIGTTLISASLLSGAAQAQTFEFTASHDTQINQHSGDENHATAKKLTLSASEQVSRILLNFDLSSLQGQVVGADIDSAVISLTVSDNDGYWGKGKKARLDIHQLNEDVNWHSDSATWNCQQDLDLSNTQSDCDSAWDGGSYVGKAVDKMNVGNTTSGVIQLDVTKEIKKLLDFEQGDIQGQSGWLIKKAKEDKRGSIAFSSVEGNAAPKLTINSSATADISGPTIELVQPNGPLIFGTSSELLIFNYADDLSGVELSSMAVTLNGNDITESCQVTATSAVCELGSLVDGTQLAQVTLADNSGKSSTETLPFLYFSSTDGGGSASRWTSGAGIPNDADSRNGDYYLDVDTGDVFNKLNDRWGFVSNIKGAKGDQGETGVQGEQGIQGIQGLTGDKGEQGEQGIQGEQGDQGIQGDMGLQGIQGEKGDKGDAGDVQLVVDQLSELGILNADGTSVGDAITNNSGANQALIDQLIALNILNADGTSTGSAFNGTGGSTDGSGNPDNSGNVIGSGQSCQTIKDADFASPSGIYTVDLDGEGTGEPFNVYCEMNAQGGGWMMFASHSATATELPDFAAPVVAGSYSVLNDENWRLAVANMTYGMMLQDNANPHQLVVFGRSHLLSGGSNGFALSGDRSLRDFSNDKLFHFWTATQSYSTSVSLTYCATQSQYFREYAGRQVKLHNSFDNPYASCNHVDNMLYFIK